MKLYTEEAVRKAIDMARDMHIEGKAYMERDEYDYSKDEVVNSLTPIELPSDDEIARVGLDFSVGYNVEYWNGFKHCGEWMKQQILNQNK